MDAIFNDKSQKGVRRKLRRDLTSPEKILWNNIRNRQLFGFKFKRQYGVGNFILDFYCPEAQLAIEIDGDSHFINEDAIVKDKDREEYIKKFKIKILRFTNTDIMKSLGAVVEEIGKHLTSPSRSLNKERNKSHEIKD